MRNSAVGRVSRPRASASRRPAGGALLLAAALLACGRTVPVGNPDDVNDPGTPGTGAPGGAGPALQSITVSPPVASVPRGATQTFVATGHFADGTTAALPLATWSIADAAVASIDVGTGSARGMAEGGPVTVTATDPATGTTGSAVLTILPAALQAITLTPSDAALDLGATRQFVATGRYTDGSSRELSATLVWASSDRTVANVSGGGLVAAVAAGGPISITATERATGVSASATATVALPPPAVPVALTHFDGTAAAGESRFTVSGLDPAVEYLVRVTTASAVDPKVLTVAVAQDATYAQRVCRSWAAGPACRAGVPSAGGELFVGVSAPAGTAFAVDVAPLPVLRPGDPAAPGTVRTEEYLKLAGLAPGTVQPTLDGLSDVAADLFTYDGLGGPFGAGLLCSTVRADALPTKTCIGGVPASDAAYVTVEGWLTAHGADYALRIVQ